jgi:hypothetical protein
MILYLKDPKKSTKKLLDLKNVLRKVVPYKINTQKSVAFVYTVKSLKKKSRKQYHSK